MAEKDTKLQIIEASLELMGQISPDKFSASKLAQVAGVSKATIFHYFPTFEEVPLAAIDLMTEKLLSQPFPEGATLEKSLELLGNRVFAAVKTQRHFLCVYFTFFTRALFNLELKKQLLKSIKIAHSQINLLLSKQGLDPATANNISQIALVFLDGLSIHLLIQGNTKELKKLWSNLVEMILLKYGGKN